MSNYFNEQEVDWQKLGDFEHFVYSIVDVDEDNHIVDVLFKLAANEQIVLHRHCALNKMFVIQGEHRLYRPNGELKEVRKTGSYTSSLPDNEPHREGGGDSDVIILFSIRGDGLLYEVLDDDQNIIATLTYQDFQDLYEARLAA